MGYRLVQRGEGKERPLVVFYLVGSHVDADVRAALGPLPAIAAYDDSIGEPLPSTISRVNGTIVGSAVKDVVLVGFSAGCQAVRRELATGRDPIGAVAMDGTHGKLPPAEYQVAPWRELAEKARRGERLFVATCTQNTYVETDLPKDQRYAATVTMLRLITGFSIPPSDAPEGEHDGDLHVYGYTSETTDKAAHIRQQRIWMPEMLRRHVKPWLMARIPLRPDEQALVDGAVALTLDQLARGEGQERPAMQVSDSTPPPSV